MQVYGLELSPNVPSPLSLNKQIHIIYKSNISHAAYFFDLLTQSNKNIANNVLKKMASHHYPPPPLFHIALLPKVSGYCSSVVVVL